MKKPMRLIRKRKRRFKLMPKRCILSGAIFLWAILLFLSMSVYAQPQDASPPAERTVWDHNGSIMYLLAIGSSRELHYQKPRPGMLEAGARPDDILFKGEIDDGQISGTAYIFNAQCGKVPFRVKGPVSDNGGKIVLTGQVPRIGRNCQTVGEYTSTLEFKLLNTPEVGQLSPATVQTPIVEPPTSGPSPAEGKLPNNLSAQPGRTRQTPWTEDPWPKAPPSGVVDPNLHRNLSAEIAQTAQPRIDGPKLPADTETAATPSAQLSLPALAPAAPQSFMDKNLLAPTIIALNAALPLISILFLIVMLRLSA